MKTPKRRRENDDDDDVDSDGRLSDDVGAASSMDTTASPSLLLTPSDVLKLNKEIKKYHDEILRQIGTERTDRKDKLRKALNGICDAYLSISNTHLSLLNKEIKKYHDEILRQIGTERTDRKDKLREELNGICDAYLSTSNAYSFKLDMENAVDQCKSTLERTCKRVEESCTVLSKAAVENLSMPPQRTYASVANQRSRRVSIFPDKVSLDNCRPFPITTAKLVLVGPCDEIKNHFTSARDTKETFFKSINPLDLKLKTNRIHYTANNTIVIEADNINVERGTRYTRGTRIPCGIIYSPPKAGYWSDVEDAIVNCNGSYDFTIIMGDFNIDWSSNSSTRSTLADSLASCHLVPVAFAPTHHTNDHSHSTIDYMCVSDIAKVTFFKQTLVPSISKHDILFATLSFPAPLFVPTHVRRRSYKNFDLNKLLKDLADVDWDILRWSNDIDFKVTFLSVALTRAYDSHAPYRVYTPEKPSSPWFLPHLKSLILARNNALRDCRHRGGLSAGVRKRALDRYKYLRKIVKHAVMDAKFNYYKDHLANCTNSTQKWKIIHELGIAKSVGSAPLPDTPDAFSAASKGMLSDYSGTVGQYLQFLPSKEFVLDNNILAAQQSGFRKGHSTHTAVVRIADEHRGAINDECVTLIVGIDFSRDFDLVNIDILLRKLSAYGFSDTACSWVSSYLSDRSQIVVFPNGDVSAPLRRNSGVPQGSLPEPLFFSLFINDLPNTLSYCDYQLYVDDFVIFLKGKITDLEEIIYKVNIDLDNISHWAVNNGLIINASKTQAMWIGSRAFMGRINSSILPPILLDGIAVRPEESLMVSGVMFDWTLSWRAHCTWTNFTV
ncbi:hypothetical protein TSAR_010080 [Trichomalopsis sarcophagae]|uniref:Reverse transcriptase domain-containing protein n=1 Tax=Trichomalopsis sarcophagae TaxID=543379 RepID=A0A232EDJ2_9HYME|nr:hypothetical protein TSAR_010080 [Trichomalopsis sarcophagae]